MIRNLSILKSQQFQDKLVFKFRSLLMSKKLYILFVVNLNLYVAS